jgi:hypothetical protein
MVMDSTRLFRWRLATTTQPLSAAPEFSVGYPGGLPIPKRGGVLLSFGGLAKLNLSPIQIRLPPPGGVFEARPTQLRSREPTSRGRGANLPKVEPRFVCTHPATSQSSLASWEAAFPAPVPFRDSYFTAGSHRPAATPQRLRTRLSGFWSYRPRPFAHSIATLRDALQEFAPFGWR